MTKLTPEQRSAIAKKAAAKSAEVRSKKAAKKKTLNELRRRLLDCLHISYVMSVYSDGLGGEFTCLAVLR